jgi:UDPglucose 6-dehydrogenase
MDEFSSSASSSGESGFDVSTVPTTPELSPIVEPQISDKNRGTHFVSQERSVSVSESLGPSALSGADGGLPIRNVCVIGAGYVGKFFSLVGRMDIADLAPGGPSAAVLALHNPSVKVTVLDRDAARIRSWNSNHLPIHEPGLGPIVRLARDGGMGRGHRPDITPWLDSMNFSGTPNEHTTSPSCRQSNLRFSTDSAGCISSADIIILAVNTPTKLSGRGAGAASDLSAVEGAVRDIAQFAKSGAIIVEKSTVPSGTANLINEIVSFVVRLVKPR